MMILACKRLAGKCRAAPLRVAGASNGGSLRGIYTRGTGLDSRAYNRKKAELEVEMDYYSKLAGDEALPEVARQEARDTLDQITEKHAHMEDQPETEDLQFRPILDRETARKNLEKIAEIDSNPESAEAKAYYKAFEEIEKASAQKKIRRPSNIIIKNMRKGKETSRQEVMIDENGDPMTEAQIEFLRRHVNFAQYSFPEVNPIEVSRPDYKGNVNTPVKLQTYRHPVDETRGERKGIVTFLHGYGDYGGRCGYMGPKFAAHGYEFHTIDQRGFGFSEGRDSVVESQDIVLADLDDYTAKIDSKYGGADVPHFLVGHSLGGLLSASLCAAVPDRFAGMSLVAPFFGLSEIQQAQFDKLKPLAKVFNWVMPTKKMTFSSQEVPAWYAHWL